MNYIKTSIVVTLLAFLVVGCYSTKVKRSTAVADSLALAAKKQERMDSVMREYRISEARKERELQQIEARKQNPRNIIDSIRCGLDSKKIYSVSFSDSVWVTYEIVEPLPEVTKTTFPNVVFFRECKEEILPIVCQVKAYSDNHIYRVQDFNELSAIIGSKDVDLSKRIEVFIYWLERFNSPLLKIEAISPFSDTTSYNARYNYKVTVSDSRYRYYFFQYEDGVFLKWTANNAGVVE